jgi:hypothetical protein
MNSEPFDRSIRRQIEINRARTPTQRFEALCDLLDFARMMAPRDAAACERRRRVRLVRQREREQWHAECRRMLATGRVCPPRGF